MTPDRVKQILEQANACCESVVDAEYIRECVQEIERLQTQLKHFQDAAERELELLQDVANLKQELEQTKERERQLLFDCERKWMDIANRNALGREDAYRQARDLEAANARLRETLTQVIACLEPSDSSLGMKARKIAEAALTDPPAKEKP